MNTGCPQELAIVARVQSGDREAFETLWRRHQRAMYGAIRARSRSDADAEEILQSASLLVLEHVADYRAERAPFPSFLHYWALIALARFYATSWHRRTVLVEEVFRNEMWSDEPAITDHMPLPIDGSVSLAVDAPGADMPAAAATYEKLLYLAVRTSAGWPHQFIAFMLTKDVVRPTAALIAQCNHVGSAHERPVTDLSGDASLVGSGAPRQAPLVWRPRRVVAELSHYSLRSLCRAIAAAYAADAGLSPGQSDDAFQPLFAVVSGSGGMARLEDHYTAQSAEGRAQNLAQWSFAVQRRVRKAW